MGYSGSGKVPQHIEVVLSWRKRCRLGLQVGNFGALVSRSSNADSETAS